MIPSLRLPFEFDAARLRDDLGLFTSAEWIPHFNTHYYEGDWSGISLRAAAGAHVELYPDPTATSFCDTSSMHRCSYVAEVLRQFECELETVRFLRLGPKAVIREHRDYKLSIEDGVARIHIPIRTSPDVKFYLANELIPMGEGEAWYLNFNLQHRVENNSASDRVHLVVDCIANDWLRSFFNEPV